MRPNRINQRIKQISKALYKIRHWDIRLGCYSEIQNEEATWFVDPPYQFGGGAYVESNKNINFNELREWCLSRNGQVIVCENTKADWMRFSPIKNNRGNLHTTIEAMWTNEPTSYGSAQINLFESL